VRRRGQVTHVHPFPISVDYPEPSETPAESAPQPTRRAELLASLGVSATYLGVGVDRIDYTKGILERIRALDTLWTESAELPGYDCFRTIWAFAHEEAGDTAGAELRPPREPDIELYGGLPATLAGLREAAVADGGGRRCGVFRTGVGGEFRGAFGGAIPDGEWGAGGGNAGSHRLSDGAESEDRELNSLGPRAPRSTGRHLTYWVTSTCVLSVTTSLP